MKISWLGHASFLLEIGKYKLVTDPAGEKVGYPNYKDKVDIVTISHEHFDHNAIDTLSGEPIIIRKPGVSKINGLTIQGIKTFHDKNGGINRGSNTVFKIVAEDIAVVHLGDIGHPLEKRQIKEIGLPDVLLLPVGGVYTIDADDAFEVVKQLNPRVVIPMHYKTPSLSFNLAPVEEFTQKLNQVVKIPYVEITKDTMEKQLTIIVLEYLR
ncbi:MAG: MBL fold metallo-hydrolase [Syntrophomonadaceae bacterium]|nr:MBL fold metallo-hydrolase [Syntrophomonadaceae bacterium]